MKILKLLLCFLIFYSCNGITEKKEQSDEIIIRDGLNLQYFYYKNEEIRNSDALNYFNLGQDKMRKGNLVEAKKLFLKSDQIEPDNLIVLNALGNIESHLKNFDKSYDYFYKAIKIDSLYSVTYLNLGTALNENFKEEQAIEVYDKGLNLKNNFVSKSEWYYSIAIAYYNLDDIGKSMEFNEKALIYVKKPELRESILLLKNILAEL